jgi:hypothetical protein
MLDAKVIVRSPNESAGEIAVMRTPESRFGVSIKK